mmetsp:Transcript_11414/g.22117  ORF Transcript_11414/g.22117 Transcript_11414/m.22117 type:complete len:666 (+) Transcript_11414:157-2154(+)
MLFAVLVQVLACVLQHPNAAAVQVSPYRRTHSAVGITICAKSPAPSFSTHCVLRPSPHSTPCASASRSPVASSCMRPLSPRLLRRGSRTPRRCVPRCAHLLMHAPLVREAEVGFVDGSNLEEGESLLRALKAFDSHGRCLCAGALVRTPHHDPDWTTGADPDEFTSPNARFTSGKRAEAAASASESRGAVHLWLADADLPELGPNMQLRGALCVLDALLLEHLIRYGTHDSLVVHASGELAVASAAAAAARGFEQTEEDGSWTFDALKGSEAYQFAATREGDADDEGREIAAAIVAMLTRKPGTLRFPQKSVGQVELSDGKQYVNLVAKSFDRGAAPSLLLGVLGAEVVSEARRLSAQAVAEGACQAADDARRVVLVRAGREVESAHCASLRQLQQVVRPGVSRVLEYVRRHVGARQPAVSGGLPCAQHVLVLTDCFVQHFGTSGDDAGGCDGASGRQVGFLEGYQNDADVASCDDLWQSVLIPPNAEFTALIQLTSVDGHGGDDYSDSKAGAGVYLQLGVHASSRLRVPLAVTGSAFVHDYTVQSMVRLCLAWREAGRQAEQGRVQAVRRTPSRGLIQQYSSDSREIGHRAGQGRIREQLGSQGRETAVSALGALLVLHFASVASLTSDEITGSSPASWLWDRARRGDAKAQHLLARSLEQGAG